MTELLIILQVAMQGQIPWGIVGTLITSIVAGIGYFIKQDKQISKQADKILTLEEAYKAQQAQIEAIKTSINQSIASLKKDIVEEMKAQERETRELREKIIRMEERILAGIKRVSSNP